jgi:hypothetical protein
MTQPEAPIVIVIFAVTIVGLIILALYGYFTGAWETINDYGVR